MIMEISTDERFLECLRYLAAKLKQPLQKVSDRYLLLVPPTIDTYYLTDLLVYQIVTTMKARYLQDKIKINRTLLIKILVNYDKKTDMVIATALLKLGSVLLLDALYDFGISKLKYRWDEVAQLVNENRAQLTQKPLYDELLRFLILNMDHKMKEAHVMVVNDCPAVCNSKLEPIKTDQTNVLDALVEAAPRQIFIHIDQNMAPETVKEIQQLFPNCICIEYSAVL